MSGKGVFALSMGSVLAHTSPAFRFRPQYPQVTPSLSSHGLCEAHVPRNSPPLIKSSRTDIITKNSATTVMEIRSTVMFINLSQN